MVMNQKEIIKYIEVPIPTAKLKLSSVNTTSVSYLDKHVNKSYVSVNRSNSPIIEVCSSGYFFSYSSPLEYEIISGSVNIDMYSIRGTVSYMYIYLLSPKQ